MDAVLDSITERYLELVRRLPRAPGPLARDAALLYLSVFEVANNFERRYQRYLDKFLPVPKDASPEASALFAASQVLVERFCPPPEEHRAWEIATAALHGADVTTENPSREYGMKIAAAVIAKRTGDGSEKRDRDGKAEDFASATLGQFRSVRAPNGALPRPVTPEWGEVTPFVLSKEDLRQIVERFRPQATVEGFVKEPTSRYGVDFNEVRLRGRERNAQRTREQARVAHFWANDDDGTFKSVGHLLRFTQHVVRRQALSFTSGARIFALAAVGLADAGIAAWYAKYLTKFQLWRPVSGVRERALDINPSTVGELRWIPLSVRSETFSPQSPSWVSSHATFGAAHAAVMRSVFGTDVIPQGGVELDTDDPVYLRRYGDEPRRLRRFSEAALENAESRIYLGVQWRVNAEGGFGIGTEIGERTVAAFLRPRTSAELAQEALEGRERGTA